MVQRGRLNFLIEDMMCKYRYIRACTSIVVYKYHFNNVHQNTYFSFLLKHKDLYMHICFIFEGFGITSSSYINFMMSKAHIGKLLKMFARNYGYNTNIPTVGLPKR